MIKKLKSKVFWILMVSISAVVVSIIILFAYLNYRNTINAATTMLDRFDNFEKIPTEEEKISLNNDRVATIDLSNIYLFIINPDNTIDSVGSKEIGIEEYAIKAYEQNKESGIVKNYVYKTRKLKDGKTILILMENSKVISQMNYIYIISISIGVLLLFIIYVISKKIANIMVKPVEETLEKQKQFISDASHELKTPLAVIEANVDVIEVKNGKSKWLTYIQSEISSMDKLINNLLLLARMDNVGKVQVAENFNLSEEVNLVSSMFESMAYEKKLQIKYNIQNNIKFYGNKEDIKQVLSVLIDNAIMHTKDNGKIIIDLEKEKNIILQVKNEGNPIPEEEREKIFERFYRIDKARNRKEKRYGLGLAIAKSIVEQYEGKIEVICKNGFTIFKIILPYRQVN